MPKDIYERNAHSIAQERDELKERMKKINHWCTVYCLHSSIRERDKCIDAIQKLSHEEGTKPPYLIDI